MMKKFGGSMRVPSLKKNYFEGDDPSTKLSSLFINCITFLENNALDEEGILRISGRLTDVKGVRQILSQGETDGMWKQLEHNEHEVSAVLKQYFNEGPSLLLDENYDAFRAVGMSNETSDVIPMLKVNIAALPLPNQKVLHRLLIFLNRVLAHSDSNKMEIRAIAVIFGPLILRAPASALPQQILADSTANVNLATRLIGNYATIFEGLGFNADVTVEVTPRGGSSIKVPNSSRRHSAALAEDALRADREKSRSRSRERTRGASVRAPDNKLRSYFEQCANEAKNAHQDALKKKEKVLKTTQDKAIKEWFKAKTEFDTQKVDYTKVMDVWQPLSDAFEQAKKEKEEVVAQYDKSKKYFDLFPDDWRSSPNIGNLKPDELATLEENEAHVELKDVLLALAEYDLQNMEKDKEQVEGPYEKNQAALWKAVQELERLEITEERAADMAQALGLN